MPQKQAHGNRPQARPLACLAPAMDKKLLAYATAAGAACLGLLAQPAEARIVYTPANVPIPADGGLVQLDINNDGIPDFGFYNFAYPHAFGRKPEGFHQYSFTVGGSQAGNQIWAVLSHTNECVAVLPKGASVGPGRNFEEGGTLFESEGSYSGGGGFACKWGAAHHGAFLGLKFVVNGETHYGWAHVTVTPYSSPVLNGYAYETVANTPILTGAGNGPVEHAAMRSPASSPAAPPAVLSLLAQGSSGLAVWRRPDEM